MKDDETAREFLRLLGIVSKVREECPWDRKQTHASLKGNLVEEAYEVLEAIDGGNDAELCEELGDLLMQVMLHARMASEENRFDIVDVMRGIADKLVRRHPHVFGKTQVKNAEEVLDNWERIKRNEKKKGTSALAGVPLSMPALSAARRLQEKAARVGFDWPEVRPVVEKVKEELGELLEADDEEQRRHETGDLLFAVVNLARFLGVNPEEALRDANRRFVRRFGRMEEMGAQRGKRLEEMTLEEMDALWEAAKAEERNFQP